LEHQNTIASAFSLKGRGLQTGNEVEVHFHPGRENEGVLFNRSDLGGEASIRLRDLAQADTDRRSRIGLGQGDYVETVEHILAAIWGAGIDNITVILDNSEPPAMDGSAAPFLSALENAGITQQGALREYVEIKDPLWVEDRESFIGIFPCDTLKISYILHYPNSAIGRQFYSRIIQQDIFKHEIAPARTFCLKEEAETLLKTGYGKGATYGNTLVIGAGGPVENTLRFPDEPVRHKVLDLIGDLCLLGRPLKGRVIALRSGHQHNVELVGKIRAFYKM
jgi:UDP-3-O-acyl N-acetylglucosamine deacetylase